ncbi:hypothetical protein LEP1GSC017_3285 [Leptospira meyeri serovar Hardjo str. Went 5]|nr:hypothetical protein LEP1GSC017_3285 [Leptospira meyeri serovar Hardjo str. Went 5]EMJ87077.1 hypothetical protein LEP1GSC196_3633 [Leptospira meyeri serovar Semaranga str. Veldrot Semarang 173]
MDNFMSFISLEFSRKLQLFFDYVAFSLVESTDLVERNDR